MGPEDIGARLRRERQSRGWDVPDMARALREHGHTSEHYSLVRQIRRWESTGEIGEKNRLLYGAAFHTDVEDLFGGPTTALDVTVDGDEEIEAWELARRVAASDIGTATLERLERAVDDLAVEYPSTPPDVLLERVRRHLCYTGRLIDARMTLAEHRRLLVVGGWLSLLAATCAIDLDRESVAAARLRTAADLARETAHAELAAWCVETAAWQTLTDGDYRRAVELSQQAQRVAPRDGSAFIQATAQEGRAWARLGARRETRDAVSRLETLVSPLPLPDRPEHHYRYDPAKSEAYVATTLSWVGDPAAEDFAREVLARLEHGADGGSPRPRRAALARIDLSLALLAASKPDEAVGTALTGITSGLLVPSNYWRAQEVVAAIGERGIPEAAELRDAFGDTYSDGITPTSSG